jgi:hypothetical protein
MNENNNIIDLFSSEKFIDLIVSRMDLVDELKNRLPYELDNNENLKFVDKSFFKRVLSDITDIDISDGGLKVYFERGVKLRIDSSGDVRSHNQSISDMDYRTLKIIGELIDMGELTLTTSPFVVEMTKETMTAKYHRSLDEEFHDISATLNIHDNGLNCWGGWSGHIRANYDVFNLENSLMLMTQRMRQLNIDDIARNVGKVADLFRYCYRGRPLEINPINLARLVVEYDLQNNILLDSEFSYFSRASNGKLQILQKIETNIVYAHFRSLVERFSLTHDGDKPKISLKRGDT